MILKRIAEDEHGTYGVLIDNGAPFAVTLENPWINNKPFVSCIPIGQYKCQRYQAPTHGNTFRIMGVVDRGCILFHKGNIAEQTAGCILVAESFEEINFISGIAGSRKGFNEFLHRVSPLDDFSLIIKNA